MEINVYALEQMVASRLAEARAAAQREALVRAARGAGARRPGWRSRLRALVARWTGARPEILPVPPAPLSPRGAP